MLHVQILAVGSLKESFFRDACAEYTKRLGAFCKLTVDEIPEGRLSQNPGEAQIQSCLDNEADTILRRIPARAYVAALCVEGGQLSSPALAARLAEVQQSHSQLCFVIGGSHGLSNRVKQRAELRLSMSEMTFPHQLARVLLLEQVYRAFSITAGAKYHK